MMLSQNRSFVNLRAYVVLIYQVAAHSGDGCNRWVFSEGSQNLYGRGTDLVLNTFSGSEKLIQMSAYLAAAGASIFLALTC